MELPENYEELLSERAEEFNSTIEWPETGISKRRLYLWERIATEIKDKGTNLTQMSEKLGLSYQSLYQTIAGPKFRRFFKFFVGTDIPKTEKKKKEERQNLLVGLTQEIRILSENLPTIDEYKATLMEKGIRELRETIGIQGLKENKQGTKKISEETEKAQETGQVKS